MGSEGYLLNQFMAPATNQRDDEWGGDADRRRAFPLAVARAARDALGPDRALVYRLSGADLVDGGASHEEVLMLAEALAGDGLADALNVGIGWHEARVPTVQLLVPLGAWLPWTRAVREVVSIPVIASNRINTLDQADAALAAGDADLISLARPFLADPGLIARARDGRAVNVCIGCDQACIDRSIFDQRVSCLVNPRAGPRARAVGRSIWRSVRVAVVGGGPAGMEAARSLAALGRARDGVRGVGPPRRPVPDGVPDPRQGGLRAHDRVFRGRAGRAGGRCAARHAGATTPLRCRGSTRSSSRPA